MITLGSWCCYAIGQFLHAFAQLTAIKAAHKTTWKVTIEAVWWRLATRVFIATMILMALANNPDLIARLLAAMGFQPENTSLHMSAPLAGIFGYAFDNVLTYIPFLKGQVPQVEVSSAT